MNKTLLRTLLGLAPIAITFVGISCVNEPEVGTQGDALKCSLKYVDYDKPGTSADPRNTRARICPFPLNATQLEEFRRTLGSNLKLYQIRVYTNGTVSEILGSMSYSVPATGQSKSDLDQGDVDEGDRVAKAQSPPFNGVTVQAGRGRGGQAPMIADKNLVERVKKFLDAH